MSTPDPYETWDAAYVMGALSAQERREFESHLADCPRCSVAISELAGMPALLASVPPEQVQPVAVDAPTSLLAGLARRVERDRRRRRIAFAATGMVAAAAVAAAVVIGVRSPAPTDTAGGQRIEMTALSGSDSVEAYVVLRQEQWGTRIDVTCTYDGPGRAPAEPKATYQLVVVPTSGSVQTVSWWGVTPGVAARPVAGTDLSTAQIRYLEIRTADGTPLLRAPG